MKSLMQTSGIEHAIFSHPLLQRLTRPHPSIQNPEIRFKSQLLATILASLLFIMGVILFFILMKLGSETASTSVIVLVILAVEYFLNRAGYYHLSAGLVALMLTVGLVVMPMIGVMSLGVIFASPLVLLFMAIFFPGRVAAGVFVLLLAGFLLLNVLYPAAPLEELSPITLRTDALMFLVLQGAFIFVLVYSRNLIESQRSVELLQLNSRLEETNQALQSATDTVRQSEAKWRAILANAPVFIAYTTLEGRVEFANRALGGTLEEILHKNIYDFMSPADMERVKQTVQQAIEQKTPGMYQMTRQLDDGQTAWYSTIVGPVTVDGQETGLTFISNDITEQVRAGQEREQLQQQVIDSQKQLLKELSTPVIPILDRVIIMPIIGSIDSSRAQDMTRALLAGISANRARYVVLDVTGVPVVDTGVAQHLSRTIQAARLKGAQTIVTGISDSIAETIVDLGMDWSDIETQRDLQTGLTSVMNQLRENANHDITVN
jgi:PAS domain S-box-containing protein